MWRRIHAWIGLGLSLLVFVMALSGAILATQPLYDAKKISNTFSKQSVADVVRTITEAQPRITPQRLSISANGEAILTFSQRNHLREKTISLETGKFLPSHKEPETYRFIRELHRSFFLGENGRLIPAFSVIAMLILIFSGVALLYRRLGSVKALLGGLSWQGWANLHSALGRSMLLPLLVVVFSGLWLSGISFKLLSTGEDKPPSYPESVEELEAIPAWTLQGLKEQPMDNVREIVFPIPEDWFDVWTVKTDKAYLFVDQFSGKVLSQEKLSVWAIALDWVTLLHTGKGTIVWSIVLLISALSIPIFMISGIVIWAKGRKRGRGKVKHQASSAQATIVIAVGSENGSTWGFAKALHQGLSQAGENVRTTEMNALAKDYPKLKTLIVLTATYGDGDAPASATKFFTRLSRLSNQNIRYATLAFGDSAFPKFCAYGKQVEEALSNRYQALMPITFIDKQSAQSFSHWCEKLGEALELPLMITYQSERPKTHTFCLKSKKTFGQSMGVTLTTLQLTGDKIPHHQAGDWLAVYPPESNVPRLYSLGSNAKQDKHIEISVREQLGGLCSPWLCALNEGETIAANIIHNPNFHAPKKGSLILVGAGTGIAPFVGMIRHNHRKRPIYLFWGGRHPEVDHLYGEEIPAWLNDKRLEHFYPAWSRENEKVYVQHILARESKWLETQLRAGATIMICGSKTMAADVEVIIEQCAKNIGQTLETLKRHKRLLEDIY